jgi:hypothetical protein
VDDVEVPSASVWTHQQDDPFPGGHSYRITVPSGNPLQPALDEPIRSRLDRQRGFSWFFFLSSVLEHDDHTPFDYVLNTIDSVESTENGVIVSGIASPFIRS